MHDLRFNDSLLTRPRPKGIDAVTTLEHFAIVTYEVDPDRVRELIHPRFEPEVFSMRRGVETALMSVVPFRDVDFRAAAFLSPKLAFGQTNYRIYVRDTETGEHVVWFLGTVLDSWLVAVPRRWWKLPWHRGRFRFDCAFDHKSRRYTRFRMTTESHWAPATLEIEDTGRPVRSVDGFGDDDEAAMVILTHPLRGYFFRRDRALGSYSIWHDRMHPVLARCVSARFDLLDRERLVPLERQGEPHSIMLVPEIEFTIYLPPRRV